MEAPPTKRKPQKVDWPGGGSLLGSIPDGFYSTGQAGELIGRDKSTVKRWRKDGTYPANFYAEHGALTIWLYSEEDITIMRQIAGTKTAGRPKKEED